MSVTLCQSGRFLFLLTGLLPINPMDPISMHLPPPATYHLPSVRSHSSLQLAIAIALIADTLLVPHPRLDGVFR